MNGRQITEVMRYDNVRCGMSVVQASLNHWVPVSPWSLLTHPLPVFALLATARPWHWPPEHNNIAYSHTETHLASYCTFVLTLIVWGVFWLFLDFFRWLFLRERKNLKVSNSLTFEIHYELSENNKNVFSSRWAGTNKFFPPPSRNIQNIPTHK